jgi:uncharacterized protein YdeI (YjbR/CyaY-like superfamily)
LRSVDVGTSFFASAEAFETWLDEHWDASDGIWIRMAKKHTGIASLDGQRKRIDDDWFGQRFTPRRPRSIWSKVNRGKVEALVLQGRMRPPGLAQVRAAKADGRWERAYDGMATSSVPDDLAQALERAKLADAFAALDGRNRYAILHRLQTAKRPETRTRRIASFVEMLARGDVLYP